VAGVLYPSCDIAVLDMLRWAVGVVGGVGGVTERAVLEVAHMARGVELAEEEGASSSTSAMRAIAATGTVVSS